MKAIKQIETPCEMPNGLQWTDEGLFVMDQKTDNVYVVDESGNLLRTINTPTANGSGITVGGGFLWTASNGESASRPPRSTDTGLGYVYKLDLLEISQLARRLLFTGESMWARAGVN